jgi:hypothetical protein
VSGKIPNFDNVEVAICNPGGAEIPESVPFYNSKKNIFTANS